MQIESAAHSADSGRRRSLGAIAPGILVRPRRLFPNPAPAVSRLFPSSSSRVPAGLLIVGLAALLPPGGFFASTLPAALVAAPAALPADTTGHFWMEVLSSEAGGADTYVSSDRESGQSFAQENRLRVRTNPDGDRHRKIYLRFPLAAFPFPVTEVDAVELQLTVQEAFHHHGRFELEIHGLGEAETAWASATLSWSNAPGHDPASPSGAGPGARLLGRVSLPGTLAAGQLIVLGPDTLPADTHAALLAFVRERRGGAVGLVLSARTPTFTSLAFVSGRGALRSRPALSLRHAPAASVSPASATLAAAPASVPLSGPTPPGTTPRLPALFNPDMEQGAETAAGWAVTWTGKGRLQALRDTQQRAEGAASLRLESVGGPADGSVSQRLRVTEPRLLFVGHAMLPADSRAESLVALQVLAEDGSQLDWIGLHELRPEGRWVRFERAVTLPQNVHRVHLVFTLRGEGAAYLDGLEVFAR